ncbi:cytochrome c class I [Hymenobacter roseosalivarius DSM 11622]|uniref:Cytochrome c class I n=1 Tax=Hymenobacter roseosalivarius DSM 11622 TaxID=645990 RepID=A0A1W1VIX6_9BACT|nr:cytochrome c [Hymenobacter roseosalivarius]SMB93180.1 cytochrome c class I [Hymenobacter roseosalivarius DSM 11622]
MRKAVLAGVFPVAIALLVCTLGILFLSATGLLHEPRAAASAAPNGTKAAALDSLGQTLTTQDTLAEPLSEADLAAFAAGDAVFKGNCVQCHAINDVVVGPALRDIHKRRPISWLIPWIRNSSKMVASGDEYSVKIFNQYQKQQMPSFALTDAEIEQVIKYLEVESAKESWVVN